MVLTGIGGYGYGIDRDKGVRVMVLTGIGG